MPSPIYSVLKNLKLGISAPTPRNRQEVWVKCSVFCNNLGKESEKEYICRFVCVYFREALSFNQEVTLCGQSIWKNIEKAHELGYQVEMYYVGVASVEIAKERVALRVKNGGHGIPDKDIERRFVESIKNLPRAIRVCDIVEIYDNTNSFERVARYEQGKCLLRTVTNLSWVP